MATSKKAPKKKAGLIQKIKSALTPSEKPYATFHWNVKKYPDVLKDIEQAKQAFDTYSARGFKPHYLDAKGNKGKPMSEFDASAGSMVFIPKKA